MMNDSKFSIEQIFLENLDISKKHLKEIIGLIQERETLFKENVRRIVQDQVKWENKLLVISEDNFGESSGNKAIIDIEKEIMKLEKGKRQEEVTFWQDVSRLRLMIAESLREQKSGERKVSLMSSFGDNDSSSPEISPTSSSSTPGADYIIPMAERYIATP